MASNVTGVEVGCMAQNLIAVAMFPVIKSWCNILPFRNII
jgi:hypothetical protein